MLMANQPLLRNWRNKANNGHYAIQGHSRSPILVPIVKPTCNSVSVNNTNLSPVLDRF